MEHSPFSSRQLPEITALFERTFTQSEGESEGKTIATLVDNLVNTTDSADLFGFCAMEKSAITGCIFLSRLKVASNNIVFMLSPVAVLPGYQQSGVGQNLIHYGLGQIKSSAVEFVVTYGDPAYYCKTGFEQIGPDIIEPPYPLAFPDGWQALSLTSNPLSSLCDNAQGKAQCVEAFSNAAYW